MSLSSGEAEFYGVVKASGAALGQQRLFADLGVPLQVRVWTDSSAPMGICSRQGLGKLWHIDTQALWIQEKVRTRQVTLRKVRGELNPGDMLTKFMSSKEKVDQLVRLFGCVFMDGRPKSAPLLRKMIRLVEEGELEVHILKDIDEDGEVAVPEVAFHDLDV